MELTTGPIMLVLSVAIAAVRAQQYAAFDDPAAAPIFLPRSYAAASFPILAKRAGGCAAGAHSCLDINATTKCCLDTQYCFINPESLQPGCCAIGSVCGSQCKPEEYQCNVTTTATLTLTSSRSQSQSSSSFSSLPLITTTTTGIAQGCCGRRCPKTSQFACPSDLGNGCCPYGQSCASGGNCLSVSSDTAPATRVTPAGPTGNCESAGQTPCAASLGGGCCASLRPCTRLDGTAMCGPPTASGLTTIPQDGDGSGGLSDGAKAGIGVGVAAGASALVGGLAFWFMRHRRRRRSDADAPRPPMDEVWDDMTSDAAGPAGGSGAGGGGPGRTGLRGLARDYTGPNAAVGPYTEAGGGEEVVHAAGGAGSPTTVRRAQRRSRSGVPAEPEGPNDIVAPVEMDSQSGIVSSDRAASERRDSGSPVEKEAATTDSIEGRFELYGSDLPTPYSPATGRIVEEAEGHEQRRATPPVISPVSQPSPDLEADDPYSHVRSGR